MLPVIYNIDCYYLYLYCQGLLKVHRDVVSLLVIVRNLIQRWMRMVGFLLVFDLTRDIYEHDIQSFIIDYEKFLFLTNRISKLDHSNG